MAKRRGRLTGSVDDVEIDCCRDNAFYRLTLARIRCFATFARTGATPPWRFQTKRRRTLRKRPADCCRQYSRLVVLFLVLGQYLTQLWQVTSQIFGNSMIFQIYESISAKLSIVAAWNLHQLVPRSILHRRGVLMHLGWIFRVYSAHRWCRVTPMTS